MGRWLGVVGCLGALACSASHVSSKDIQKIRPVPTSCASTPGADTTVYDSTQVSERAAPRTVPQPEYPEAARNKKIQGRTVITAVVQADGTVDTASIQVTLSANHLLDAEARRLVSLTTFWPACRDSVAVRSRIVAPFDFTLTGNSAAVGFGVIAGLWAGLMGAMMN
jgi:TonB family protein